MNNVHVITVIKIWHLKDLGIMFYSPNNFGITINEKTYQIKITNLKIT